jgi:hypothetical protein
MIGLRRGRQEIHRRINTPTTQVTNPPVYGRSNMRYLSLCGLAVMALAAPARGQKHNGPTEIAFMDCTLKKQGKLPGESTKAGHKDAFELRDFSASADGKSFTIATGADALPLFLTALSTNEVITQCRIEVEKKDYKDYKNPGTPPPWVVVEIVTLIDARFSDVTLLVDPPKEPMVQLTLTTAGGKVAHTDDHGAPISSAFPTIDDEKVGTTRIDADFTVNGAHVLAPNAKGGADFRLKSILWTAESLAGAFHTGPLLFSMTENASADAVTRVAKAGAQLKGTKLTIFHLTQPYAGSAYTSGTPFISIELVDADVTSEDQTASTHSASGTNPFSDDFTVKVLHVRVNNLVGKTEFVQ